MELDTFLNEAIITAKILSYFAMPATAIAGVLYIVDVIRSVFGLRKEKKRRKARIKALGGYRYKRPYYPASDMRNTRSH